MSPYSDIGVPEVDGPHASHDVLPSLAQRRRAPLAFATGSCHRDGASVNRLEIAPRHPWWSVRYRRLHPDVRFCGIAVAAFPGRSCRGTGLAGAGRPGRV